MSRVNEMLLRSNGLLVGTFPLHIIVMLWTAATTQRFAPDHASFPPSSLLPRPSSRDADQRYLFPETVSTKLDAKASRL